MWRANERLQRMKHKGTGEVREVEIVRTAKTKGKKDRTERRGKRGRKDVKESGYVRRKALRLEN